MEEARALLDQTKKTKGTKLLPGEKLDKQVRGGVGLRVNARVRSRPADGDNGLLDANAA